MEKGIGVPGGDGGLSEEVNDGDGRRRLSRLEEEPRAATLEQERAE